MITLLAHSMMMFYLIGKGKAVKDAMAEHQVAGDYYRRIASARKPVFRSPRWRWRRRWWRRFWGERRHARVAADRARDDRLRGDRLQRSRR
jgi:hypothetical protein